MERYLRQTMLPEFGEDGQRRLAASSALVVGLGGLGAPVALYLTAAGIGRLGLADSDTVGLTNLQRQILYDESQIGQPKTQMAANRLQKMASAIKLDLWCDGITAQNAEKIISGYDIVVDCTDNFSARIMLDHACAVCGKPWVHGSVEGFCGQVTVFNHKNGKRYLDLYPDAESMAKLPKRVIGVLGPVPGTIGTIQAIEAIKALVGCGDSLDGRLLLMNFLDLTTEIIDF